jgi:hypothetical protein
MLRAALAASPPDVAKRWVWPAPWRHFARGPSVALQVERQSLAVMDDRACVAPSAKFKTPLLALKVPIAPPHPPSPTPLHGCESRSDGVLHRVRRHM